jgi:hypothetical protein
MKESVDNFRGHGAELRDDWVVLALERERKKLVVLRKFLEAVSGFNGDPKSSFLKNHFLSQISVTEVPLTWEMDHENQRWSF